MSPLPITGMAVSSELTEAFALTGKLPLKLDETIVPTVVVGTLDTLWGPPAVCHMNLPPAVGFRSEIELSMPQVGAGQGAAAIIDYLEVGAAANQAVSIGPSPGLAAPTHIGTPDWKDVGLRGAPAMLFHGKNDAVAVVGFVANITWRLLANTTIRIPIGWIIRVLPETGLQQGLLIRPAVANERLTLTAHWRERVPR